MPARSKVARLFDWGGVPPPSKRHTKFRTLPESPIKEPALTNPIGHTIRQDNMTEYTADIGCWDHGKNIDLPGATNVSEAVELAEKALESTVFKKPIENPYVVQVRHNGKIVWDYMNGSYCY